MENNNQIAFERLKKSLAYDIERYQKLIEKMEDDCLLKEAAIKSREAAIKRLESMDYKHK
jgi:hypothetical protein